MNILYDLSKDYIKEYLDEVIKNFTTPPKPEPQPLRWLWPSNVNFGFEHLCLGALFFFYFFMWFRSKESTEYTGRKISTIHCYILIPYIFTRSELLIAGNSIIFCLIDLIMSRKILDTQMVMHHLMSIFCVSVTYLSRPELLYLAMSSEISTIFLNNCWLLVKEKKTDSDEFVLESKKLIFSFFIFRVVNFTYLLYYYFDFKFYESYMFLPIWILNLYWFTRLIIGALHYKIL